MAKTVYYSCEENGARGAQKVADMYRNGKNTVMVEHCQIPKWGSALPSSSTYGQTEMGYKIIVDDHRPKRKSIIEG